jgi:hypothetical protein
VNGQGEFNVCINGQTLTNVTVTPNPTCGSNDALNAFSGIPLYQTQC